MNNLSAISNTIPLIDEGHKGYKPILNKDIPSLAMCPVVVLESQQFRTAWGLR